MRFVALLFALLIPLTAQAGLLDLLPLKRIERKMIYPLSTVEVEPRTLGLTHTKVHRLKPNGTDLIVWTIKATRKSAPTILYFHGNAGNLANRAQRFAILQKQGFNIVAMSYRGSSGSGGMPSETGITADALYLYQNIPSLLPSARPQNVILYGESLGAAVAIALLSKLTPNDRPAGIILEAPFTSTPDMARAMTEVPDNLIARIQNRWESLARASAITIPLIVIHGTADEVTPTTMGRAIFNAAPVQDKDFIAVRGASHSATWRPKSMARLWRFIRAYAVP